MDRRLAPRLSFSVLRMKSVICEGKHIALNHRIEWHSHARIGAEIREIHVGVRVLIQEVDERLFVSELDGPDNRVSLSEDAAAVCKVNGTVLIDLFVRSHDDRIYGPEKKSQVGTKLALLTTPELFH